MNRLYNASIHLSTLKLNLKKKKHERNDLRQIANTSHPPSNYHVHTMQQSIY